MNTKVIYIQQYINNSGYHPPKDMYPNFFTYGFGGRLGRMFKKYNNSWDVEIWRLDSSIKDIIETDYEGIHYRIFPAFGNSKVGIYSISFIKALKKLPSKTILNIQNIHTPLLYQTLLFSPSRLLITCQHHGDFHPCFEIENYKGLKRLKAIIYYALELIIIKKAKFFFIIDIDHINFLKKTYKNLDNRYLLQPMGIDFSLYNKISKEEACKELGLDYNKKYIFYLGQYYHFKEVDRLCEVYKEIKKINPNIQLIVAGGKPTDIYYSNIIECGAIDFGRISNEQLYKFYSAADVYVSMAFRNDYFGGIGLAMLEAIACGTPVVSKSLENIPVDIRKYVGKMPNSEKEMIECIIEVINNKQEYINCRNYIEKLYDYTIIQNNTLHIYKSLIYEND